MFLKKSIVELSMEEAQQLLISWRTDFLSKNSDNIKEIVSNGFSKIWSKPVNQMNVENIAFALAESDVGKNIADENQVDMVLIKINQTTAMIIYNSNI